MGNRMMFGRLRAKKLTVLDSCLPCNSTSFFCRFGFILAIGLTLTVSVPDIAARYRTPTLLCKYRWKDLVVAIACAARCKYYVNCYPSRTAQLPQEQAKYSSRPVVQSKKLRGHHSVCLILKENICDCIDIFYSPTR